MAVIETFTCVIYGCNRETSVNAVRHILLKKMVGDEENLTELSKIDLSKLPPCRDSLIQHVKRVNYRLANYKKSKDPIFWRPNPTDGHGWQKNENGIMEPLWCASPVLPQTLIDLVEPTVAELDEKEEIIHFDHEEMFDDECE